MFLHHLQLHDVDKLLSEMYSGFEFGGLGKGRAQTFCARIRAVKLLLEATDRGEINAADWSARSYEQRPVR